MRHNHYILHTIHNEAKNTKKDIEELLGYLNNGCEIIDQLAYKNEQYFVLFRPHEDIDEKKLN